MMATCSSGNKTRLCNITSSHTDLAVSDKSLFFVLLIQLFSDKPFLDVYCRHSLLIVFGGLKELKKNGNNITTAASAAVALLQQYIFYIIYTACIVHSDSLNHF